MSAGGSSGGAASAGALLLSLNFILLSFFMMLNGLEQAHKEKQKLAMASLAAGFDNAEAAQQPGAVLPHSGDSGWQPQLTTQVLGMVSNELGVATPELDADAGRLVVKLPLSVVFSGNEVTPAARKSLPNLLGLAQSAGTRAEVWVVDNGLDGRVASQRLQALAAVPGVGKIPLGLKVGEPIVTVVYHPENVGTGENLGRLPDAAANAGGDVHGEAGH